MSEKPVWLCDKTFDGSGSGSVQAKVGFVKLWVNSLKLLLVVKKEEKWDLFSIF